jgi:hypothetical protein
MVMRNRYDGEESAGWWDDLPPKVRSRFGTRPVVDPTPEPAPPPARPADGPPVLDWVRDLGRFVLLFLAVAVGNLVFLLVALSFLTGGPLVPLGLTGR